MVAVVYVVVVVGLYKERLILLGEKKVWFCPDYFVLRKVTFVSVFGLFLWFL